MGSKVILAVAGSGKTYSICRDIPRDGKTLVLAFTHSNIKNIVGELTRSWQNRFGCSVPETVRVMTFDAFVYRYAIAPYVQTIAEHFGVTYDYFTGTTIQSPPTKTVTLHGREIVTSAYKKTELKHYVNCKGEFYVANLCELLLFVRSGKTPLVKIVTQAVDKFWDYVLVDEFQDFRKHDFRFVLHLCKKLKNILLVGDYYQHSVAAKGNTGEPFKVRKKDVSFEEFVCALQKHHIQVDTNSLSASRRCPKEVCSFVSEKLGIAISSASESTGCVRWIEENESDLIMKDDSIMKLQWESGRRQRYRANNWSYSKGDTYNRVCVIMTEPTDHIQTGSLRNGVTAFVRNRLYVALTRTSSDLYLMPSTVYNEWRSRHEVV